MIRRELYAMSALLMPRGRIVYADESCARLLFFMPDVVELRRFAAIFFAR